MNAVKTHPASTTGATGSVGLLVALLLGVDDAVTIGAIGIALGLVPGVYAVVVGQGGLIGIARKLLRGS